VATNASDGSKLILVVDDMPVIRDPIAASLRAAGYRTVTAAGGEEALRTLRTAKPDLVLLDLVMPGMDGMAVLRQIRREPSTAGVPVILLTSAEGRREILEAVKYGVRDYVLKSRFSLKDLLARVSKYLAPRTGEPARGSAPAGADIGDASGAPAATTSPSVARAKPPSGPLLTRDECIRRAEAALSGKTLSGVVAQVIGAAASPRTELSQLASIVSRDPVLASRVLRAANSAGSTSSRGVISNVTDAIRQIGSAAVRNIAATVGVFDAMPAASSESFNPIRCWQHSFAVAKLCERLAGGGEEDGTAYLVGLCHDLSDILLQSQFGAEYRRVSEAAAASGRPREEVEREMLGVTHGELSAIVFRCVGLPELVREPIETFHAGRRAEVRGTHPLARALRLADWYANGLLLASGGESPVGPLDAESCAEVTGERNPPCPDGDALRAEVFGLTAALGRLSASEEAKLLAPPYPRQNARVWLARPASFSSFDPVAAALGSLGDVTASATLPSMEVVPNYRGLVIISDEASVATHLAEAERLRAGPSKPGVLVLQPRSAQAMSLPATSSPAAAYWPTPVGALAAFAAAVGVATGRRSGDERLHDSA
jgi:CheY-like chemotaxis protein/HD-like signal output (HDOD) protein